MYNVKRYLIVFTILTTAIFIETGNAQNPKNYYKEWILVGIGKPAPQEFLSGVISYNFGKKNVFQLAVNANSEFSLSNSAPYIISTSLSIGKRKMSKYKQIAGFVGPSFIYGCKKNKKYYTTAGAYINLQMIMKYNEFGAGIDLFGVINNKVNSGGIRFVIYFGNKR